MELFRACCGSNLSRLVDDSHEVKPFPQARAKRIFKAASHDISYCPDHMLRQPINITRVKSNQGDDIRPLPSEDDGPQHTVPRRKRRMPTGPNTRIFSTKFTAPTPKGDEVENETDQAMPKLCATVKLGGKGPGARVRPDEKSRPKFGKKSSSQGAVKRHEFTLTSRTKKRIESPKGLDAKLREACSQLNKTAVANNCRTYASNTKLQRSTSTGDKRVKKITVVGKSRARSPEAKGGKSMQIIVPSENSAFTFRPSVVRLELTERYRFEAGLATTLAKAQDCLKNSRSSSKPAYSMSNTPASTAGTFTSSGSVKSLRSPPGLDLDSPLNGRQTQTLSKDIHV